MHRVTTRIAAAALFVGLAAPVAAQQAALSPLKRDMMAQFDDAATKVIQLAEAIPAEKYAWRPAPGVRSVREVLGHVAGGNIFILRSVGVEPTGAMLPDSVMDKARVVASVKAAADHFRNALRNANEADFDKAVTLFGSINTTQRGTYMLLISHNHEHLGQLIAYARSNGVTPPWSMAGGN